MGWTEERKKGRHQDEITVANASFSRLSVGTSAPLSVEATC